MGAMSSRGGAGQAPLTPTASRLVWHFAGDRLVRRPDELAIEEPLEIRLATTPGAPPEVLTVTMRTPGHDFELAGGWLLGEGVIDRPEDVRAVRYCMDPELDGEQRYNVVTVDLVPAALNRLAEAGGATSRLTATSSSCGVCGTASIEAITSRIGGSPHRELRSPMFAIADVVGFPDLLRQSQPGFSTTGGLHAAGLVSSEGHLIVAREDIGRHNAVDKVIGWALQQVISGSREMPLADLGLVVSGRSSFEIVQKATVAGIALVVSVSAASSVAARLAEEQGVTLVGFAREGSGTVYSHPERLSV
jgi:FdhD protein